MLDIPLGTIFTVTDVAVNAIYMDTEMELGGMRGVAKCVMSYDEYEKYFEKVVEEPKHTWTEWRVVDETELWNIIGELYENHYVIKYLKHYLRETDWRVYTRNNGKKTDVKFSVGLGVFGTNFKSTSTCNKHFDEFDEKKGMQVAIIKIFPKMLAHFAKRYIENHY